MTMPAHSPHPARGVVRRSLGRGLAALIVVALGVAVTVVLTGRYQLRPVLSGSMRPGLPVGGVVVTERVPIASLRVRDVVVLHRPDRPRELVVHRIVGLTAGPSGPVVQTQGDANDTPDRWQVTLRGGTVYRAVFSVPLVGYVALWAHSATGRTVLLGAGGLLLVAAAGLGNLTNLRCRKRAVAGPAATAVPASA